MENAPGHSPIVTNVCKIKFKQINKLVIISEMSQYELSYKEFSM